MTALLKSLIVVLSRADYIELLLEALKVVIDKEGLEKLITGLYKIKREKFPQEVKTVQVLLFNQRGTVDEFLQTLIAYLDPDINLANLFFTGSCTVEELQLRIDPNIIFAIQNLSHDLNYRIHNIEVDPGSTIEIYSDQYGSEYITIKSGKLPPIKDLHPQAYSLVKDFIYGLYR